jgi:alpha-tubulin suppressor-like RCC1 family protein
MEPEKPPTQRTSISNRSPKKRYSNGNTSTASSSAASSPLDEKEQNRRSHRLSSQVLSIYQVHSPDKLEQRGFLRILLKHFRGREESLVTMLAQKFAPEHQQRVWLPPLRYDLGLSIRIVKIACGRKDCFAVSHEGNVYALKGETVVQKQHQITFPEQGTKITDIACGDLHTLALSSNGIVYSWGNNNFGQLGIGSRVSVLFPTKIIHGNIIASKIYCGATHSIIIGIDQTYCFTFGNGRHGRLGVGGTSDRLVPTRVQFPDRVKIEKVITGTKRTIFITIVVSTTSNEILV